MNSKIISLVLVLVISISAFGQQTNETTKVTGTGATDTSRVLPITPSTIAKFDVPKVSTAKVDLESPVAAKTVTSASSSSTSDEWHYEITPYIWLAGITGNLRVRDTTVRIDSSGGDVLSQVDFAFATHFEAHKNRIGFFVDENYVNLGTSGLGNGPGPLLIPYDVQPTMNIFEVGPSYTIYALPNEDSSLPDVFSVEALGGLRWFHLGLGLTAGNNHAEGSRNLVDGFGGGRIKFRPHPKWTLIGKATIGGGGSQSAWTATGLLDYQFHRNFSVNGGYQVLDMNADNSSNVVGFDGRLKGIIMGLTIHR